MQQQSPLCPSPSWPIANWLKFLTSLSALLFLPHRKPSHLCPSLVLISRPQRFGALKLCLTFIVFQACGIYYHFFALSLTWARGIFVLSNLFFVLDSTGSIFNLGTLFALPFTSAWGWWGAEPDRQWRQQCCLWVVRGERACDNIELFGRSSIEKVWLCQHQDHQQVKNGRTDDVMWEFGLGDVKRGEKEEEVREAEEKQVNIFVTTFVKVNFR